MEKTVTFKFEILVFHSVAVSALRRFASSVCQTPNINFMYKVDMSS